MSSGGSDVTVGIVLGIGSVVVGETVSVGLAGTVTDVAVNPAAPVARTDVVWRTARGARGIARAHRAPAARPAG